MSNLNEIGKFDSIFQNAAINYELPYDEGAWNLMQQKLDTEQSKKKRGGFWWWLPITAIVLGVGIYTVTKNNSKQNSNVATTNFNKTVATENLNEIGKENVPLTLNNKNHKKTIITKNHTELVIKESNELATKNNTTAKPNPILCGNTLNKSNSTKLKKIGNNSQPKDAKIISTNYNKNITNIPNVRTASNSNIASNSIMKTAVDPNNKSTEYNLNYIQSSDTKNGTRYYTATNLPLHNRYIINFDKLEKENNDAVALQKKELEKENAEEAFRSKYSFLTQRRNTPSTTWYATASIGNNIGFIDRPQIEDSKLQYQFMIGYKLTKFVSFETGIIIGSRTFNASTEQYNAYVSPIRRKFFLGASSDISVIDIPINIKYQFSDRENFGFFTTAGFSTLFMHKENYSLAFNYGSGIHYEAKNFSNTSSILSLLNFSLGYQFPINKNFNLTAEPYLQLPFNNIGSGGTKMSSIGFKVGGQYNFNKKKKK